MSDNKSIARRFIQEVFNEGKIEDAHRYVIPDIIYHGVFEEVRGLEHFKKWIKEDRDAFPDMHERCFHYGTSRPQYKE
jgi:predicted SnoaL-like aldol condensation-catalyzing enzyme